MTEPQLTRHAYDGEPPSGEVSFTAMADGTADDYALLDRYERAHAAGLADRVLSTLDRLTGSMGGYRITRLEHSLQSATRARLDGAGVEWVVAALVHDIGDELAPFNHSELAAAIVQPYVAEEVHWVVLHHGVFQSYYYAHHLGGDRDARDRYRGHRWAGLCEEFCARWDQNSFDPDFPIHGLESFEDDVREVFGRVAWDPGVVTVGSERLS
ncbi:MAG: HD domain-containing protein [Ilumatobacter sp.]|uniref:HD domain-containing protein n=1 Tax=Ilumatobacter sp. TaxID=1967498 RepID=UPI0026093C30|nr:HD domain-containing protein [Ilumatobacter sp.]MDJ0768666.1 HD domain-containing protein [Ilumatobacter sp.]